MYIFFATRTFLNFTVNHKRMNRCPRRWKITRRCADDDADLFHEPAHASETNARRLNRRHESSRAQKLARHFSVELSQIFTLRLRTKEIETGFGTNGASKYFSATNPTTRREIIGSKLTIYLTNIIK